MLPAKRKIINDPVYGFITLQHPLILDVISHPYYQRLRRIGQMALAQLVYPGAVHTRLHHSLGAYHLMCQAVVELRSKGIEITPEEETAVKNGILLHDIGHGPYSHALENVLTPGISHEMLSEKIMDRMNRESGGQLSLAIQIFKNDYPKPFLHQLISSQLDMDRMDYLTRDSFFTGVSEGVIGYDRILKMLTVYDGDLMVEEKGIYSVEKFLVARRQMYWQVYLHKTVLAAEKMLVKIIERAREIYDKNDPLLNTGAPLNFFLSSFNGVLDEDSLTEFCGLDDTDVMFAIKRWSHHKDRILSILCQSLLNRKLYKCTLQVTPIDEMLIPAKRKQLAAAYRISEQEASYFAFTGEASNTMYKPGDEHINILLKSGNVKEISKVDNPLIHQTISMPVKKFYICLLQ